MTAATLPAAPLAAAPVRRASKKVLPGFGLTLGYTLFYLSIIVLIPLFTVQELFGSLGEAQKVHFNDGGQFDKLYTVGR